MKIVVKILYLSVLLLTINCAGATDSTSDYVANTDFMATESFSYSIHVTSETDITISTGNGKIEVIGVAGSDSVIVTGKKTVKSESVEDAQEHLSDLIISVESQSTEVMAIATPPSQSSGRYYGVEFTVYIPDNFEVYASNVNHDITIESVKNTVYTSNTNGGINLDGIYGNIYVTLVDGSVAGRAYLPAGGEIDMEVTNGNAVLYIPKTTSAELTTYTSNGSIHIDQLDFTKVLIDQTISFQGELGSANGTIYIDVLNGNITILGF